MSNLKELKSRIHVARATSKITAAMKMIATSKFRKTQKVVSATTNALKTLEPLRHVLYTAEPNAFDSPWWSGYNNDTELLFVGTSFRGLCGGYNAGLLKRVRDFIEERHHFHKKVEVIFLGTKGYETFRTQMGEQIVVTHLPLLKDEKNLEESLMATTQIILDHVESTGYSRVHLAMNKYMSAISQEPLVEHIFPHQEYYKVQQEELTYIPTFEPTVELFAEQYFKTLFKARILKLLAENKLSEHASRMNAMDNAQNNAQDLIDELSLEYNKSRQDIITRELLEIIAGKEAL